MLISALISVLCFSIALPYLPWGAYFGLVPLPLWFYGVLTLLVTSYLLMDQIIKTIFYKMTASSGARADRKRA